MNCPLPPGTYLAEADLIVVVFPRAVQTLSIVPTRAPALRPVGLGKQGKIVVELECIVHPIGTTELLEVYFVVLVAQRRAELS